MTNLGTLPGDVLSVANDINAQGQVVGVSCDADGNCRAFLWDQGVMMDLNSLIPPGSPLYLTYGSGINDQGEIAGYAFRSKQPRRAPGFLAILAPAAQIAGDSAQKIDPARKHPRVASATTAPWSPDDTAMTCKRGADNPCLARLRGRRLCASRQ